MTRELPMQAPGWFSIWKGADVRLFWLGLACALVQFPLGLDLTGFGHPYETTTVAANFAATGEFRDPFGIPTGPSAHLSPVYPFLLGIIMKVARTQAAIVWAAVVFNSILAGWAAALMPRISLLVFGHAAPGIAGAVLLTISYRLIPQWETALASLVLLWAVLAILEGGPLAAGLWCGISLFANPVSLPTLAVMMFRKSVRFVVIAALIAIAVCVPWTIRNWVLLGAPYFIRDSFGLQVWISNNDRATPDLVSNRWSFDMLIPNQNPLEAEKVAAMGEGPYNQALLKKGLNWIRSHPGRFFELCAGRVFYYWLPPLNERWQCYSFWLVTALSGVGIWMARRNRTAMLLALAGFSYSLPFVLIEPVGRYRFPSIWISALLAGYAVAAFVNRLYPGAAGEEEKL